MLFWSIIVKRALVHFNISFADDVAVVAIPILQTPMFIMTDPIKFSFIGTIP